jgi:hypothetical protein
LLLTSGLVTTTPTEQSPGDPQNVRYRTIAAGQMPKLPTKAMTKSAITRYLGVSMVSDSELVCTKCLVNFWCFLWFPNWDSLKKG